jgi:2-dehydropantoate 2-reductase
MINPLTVIFARRNGDLFGHAPIQHLMTRLLAEAAATVAALPELRDIPGARERFAPAALERRVLAVAEATAMNTSSMLQDVRAGRGTEIEFINGFVVRRAEALGVHCGLNRALVEMVKAGQVIGEGDINDCFPVS